MSTTVYWEIIPLETPKVVKKCSRCNNNEFQSSDVFRINLCKKMVDVWLIYKCTYCDFTWNMDILSRKTVSSIDPITFKKFQENDRDLAWRYAFNKNTLGNNKVQQNWDISFSFNRSKNEVNLESNVFLTITLTSEYELGISIRKVLQKMFSISNAQIKRFIDEGDLIINSDLQYTSNKVGSRCKIEMTRDLISFL